MEIINEEQFKLKIYSEDVEIISNLTIEIDNYFAIDLSLVNLKMKFENLIFKGIGLKIYDSRIEKENLHILFFKNCQFYSPLNFHNCNFQELRFEDYLHEGGRIVFDYSNFNEFYFLNAIFKKTQFLINTINVKSFFEIDTLIFNSGKFKIQNSIFNDLSTIKNSSFDSLNLYECSFNSYFSLTNNKISNSIIQTEVENCNFKNSYFNNNSFNSFTFFKKNVFYNTAIFEKLNYKFFPTIKFLDCNFEKAVSFNQSRVYEIFFSNIKFSEKASFQETYFDLITIDKSFFEKGALFDDIQIQKIDDCDRRTIRTIKQELQKAENKIDFSRFRVYEFNAYRKDIRKKLDEFKKDKNRFYHRKREPIQLKRDLFILNVSDIVSEYGTDWKRAIKFTLLSGLAAFTLFFILENFDKSFKLSNWQDFVYGYFRFFLITDFKNEYYETGESVLKFNCIVSLVPFILGKIAVAFGLYEMIQSFRKFKA